MHDNLLNPLDELDEAALLRLLGRAWCAQLHTHSGESYYLPGDLEIGRREFNIVLPVLTEALRQPFSHGVAARVQSTLQVEATWIMPAAVVAALARRRGLIEHDEHRF